MRPKQTLNLPRQRRRTRARNDLLAALIRGRRTIRIVVGALVAVLVVAALGSTANAQSDSSGMPVTVRVRLTVDTDLVQLALPIGSVVRVDGHTAEFNPSPRAIIFGKSLRYLGIPGNVTLPSGLGVAETHSMLDVSDEREFVGPYVGSARQIRDRRVLRSELGVAPFLTAPRAGLHLDRYGFGLPHVLEVEPSELTDAITVNGRSYRGRLRVDFTGDQPLIVNEVALSEYLASVVGSEMPSSWELEALKAQAVAARNYVLKRIEPNSTYDICDSQNCQAYLGMDAETPTTIRAVEETRGLVATYLGEMITAYYSANAGDATVSSGDVWGMPIPYLNSVASPHDAEALSVAWGSSGYRWRRIIPVQSLAGIQTGEGGVLGTLTDVRVLRTSRIGRPLDVRLEGEQGTLVLSGDRIRTVLNIPSAFAEFELAPTKSLVLLNPSPRRVASLLRQGYVLESRRRSLAFDWAPPDIRLDRGSLSIIEFFLPARVVVYGRGFGHGVGMSQWGAQGLALEGHSFIEILSHYYQGIEVQPLETSGVR